MPQGEVRIEYMPLSKLRRWPRNPKDHDLGTLHQSISRFGFVSPIIIDERTGKLVAGHGRLDVLQQKKVAGEKPPARIKEVGDEWYVPVIRGISFNSDEEAEAYAIADNRTTELGGWDEVRLAEVLSDLAAADALEGVGWDADDIDALLAQQKKNVAAQSNPYVSKVEPPIYEPQGRRPEISELFDDQRAQQLLEHIRGASGITEEERYFLELAAMRHVVFHFDKIANYYAHASPEMQRLMEESALVILDFDSAIERGFVKLVKALAEIYQDEYKD